MSNENVLCLCGKLVEVLYEEVDPLLSPLKGDDASAFERGMDAMDISHNGKSFDKLRTGCLRETARYILDPTVGNFGCVVPAGVWHTVEVLEPSVIYEAKDGRYGQDGSETF